MSKKSLMGALAVVMAGSLMVGCTGLNPTGTGNPNTNNQQTITSGSAAHAIAELKTTFRELQALSGASKPRNAGTPPQYRIAAADAVASDDGYASVWDDSSMTWDDATQTSTGTLVGRNSQGEIVEEYEMVWKYEDMNAEDPQTSFTSTETVKKSKFRTLGTYVTKGTANFDMQTQTSTTTATRSFTPPGGTAVETTFTMTSKAGSFSYAVKGKLAGGGSVDMTSSYVTANGAITVKFDGTMSGSEGKAIGFKAEYGFGAPAEGQAPGFPDGFFDLKLDTNFHLHFAFSDDGMPVGSVQDDAGKEIGKITVAGSDPHSGKASIVYKDGATETLDLLEIFELFSQAQNASFPS